MPPVGFEPTISAGERPKSYALDRAATGTGDWTFTYHKIQVTEPCKAQWLLCTIKRFYILPVECTYVFWSCTNWISKQTSAEIWHWNCQFTIGHVLDVQSPGQLQLTPSLSHYHCKSLSQTPTRFTPSSLLIPPGCEPASTRLSHHRTLSDTDTALPLWQSLTDPVTMDSSHTQTVNDIRLSTAECLVSFSGAFPHYRIHNVSTAEDHDDVAVAIIFLFSQDATSAGCLRHWRTVRQYGVVSQTYVRGLHTQSPLLVILPVLLNFSIHTVCNGMLGWYVRFRRQIETRLSNTSKSGSSPFLLNKLVAAGWAITGRCVSQNITTPHRTAVPRIVGTTCSYFDHVLDPHTLPIALVHYDGLMRSSVAIRNG